MTLTSPQGRYTPQDVLDMEDDYGLFELVDGMLVREAMSSLANQTAGFIITSLNNFNTQTRSGFAVYPEQSFQCFAHDPELVRRPDVALIVANRLTGVPEDGHVQIRPDLAIEVISPNDRIYKFERKLADYRKAAIKLVWEVNPEFRFIRVYRLDRAPERLEETDTLRGEPVLPGFSVEVRELLPAAEGGTV